jgi:hypothetical protein
MSSALEDIRVDVCGFNTLSRRQASEEVGVQTGIDTTRDNKEK